MKGIFGKRGIENLQPSVRVMSPGEASSVMQLHRHEDLSARIREYILTRDAHSQGWLAEVSPEELQADLDEQKQSIEKDLKAAGIVLEMGGVEGGDELFELFLAEFDLDKAGT
jgi:hypothetical protein